MLITLKRFFVKLFDSANLTTSECRDFRMTESAHFSIVEGLSESSPQAQRVPCIGCTERAELNIPIGNVNPPLNNVLLSLNSLFVVIRQRLVEQKRELQIEVRIQRLCTRRQSANLERRPADQQ